MPAEDPSFDPLLVRRRVRVQDDDVVWLRSLLEAYDGLALLFGDGSGTLTLAAPADRGAELDELLAELAHEARLHVL